MDSPLDDLSAEKSLASSLSSEYQDTFISDNHFNDDFAFLNDDFLSFEYGGQRAGGSSDTSNSSSPSEVGNTQNQDNHDYDYEALLDFTSSFKSTYESLSTPTYEALEAEQNSQIERQFGSATTADDKSKQDQADNEGDSTIADEYLDLDFEFDELFEPQTNSISSTDTNSDTNSENMPNSAVQPQSSSVSSPPKPALKVIVIRSSEVSVKSSGDGVNKKRKSSTGRR